MRALWLSWTARKTSGSYIKSRLNYLWGQKYAEAVLLWVHHEKARFSGKDNGAGKVKWSRKIGRPNSRGINSLKDTKGLSMQEVSGAVEDRTFWRSLIHRVAQAHNNKPKSFFNGKIQIWNLINIWTNHLPRAVHTCSLKLLSEVCGTKNKCSTLLALGF